ncbi:uncharacterized protein J4E84_007510 [Alternaria hordeiaustralica]|uniref:uncharacterized protein n=1 Tax=Alternaria hordeiaustralica TaxID=1187925 RepID=UPI0020C3CDF3|nr:uncharacterized protein J4E84_007510 [Alternaria hordeiaustralica]KAI4681913.1 hypothetical protein J4E84_007510 [Alternaria hordeiaustralica]
MAIVVNGAPLPEYDDDSDTPASPTTVTKYVEATSGANFAIQVSVTEDFPFPKGDMLAAISLDGQVIERGISPESRFFHTRLYHGRSSQIGGHPKIQKFCFAELEIGRFIAENLSYIFLSNVKAKLMILKLKEAHFSLI